LVARFWPTQFVENLAGIEDLGLYQKECTIDKVCDG
jgi:hypothetical protein